MAVEQSIINYVMMYLNLMVYLEQMNDLLMEFPPRNRKGVGVYGNIYNTIQLYLGIVGTLYMF